MRRILGITLLSLLLTTGGCASLAKDGAMMRASSNYSDGDYEEAISIVERSMRVYEYNDEEKAQMLFLKALSWQKLGDVHATLSTLGYIAYTYPETEYGFRASAILSSLGVSEEPLGQEI